jgi:hypothetical protein
VERGYGLEFTDALLPCQSIKKSRIQSQGRSAAARGPETLLEITRSSATRAQRCSPALSWAFSIDFLRECDPVLSVPLYRIFFLQFGSCLHLLSRFRFPFVFASVTFCSSSCARCDHLPLHVVGYRVILSFSTVCVSSCSYHSLNATVAQQKRCLRSKRKKMYWQLSLFNVLELL